MPEPEGSGLERALDRIRSQARKGEIRITAHAHQEMVEENITTDELLQALEKGKVLENYPEHRRGACCLLSGFTAFKRPIHVVCTTGRELLIVITAYEPRPPKWRTPTVRGGQNEVQPGGLLRLL